MSDEAQTSQTDSSPRAPATPPQTGDEEVDAAVSRLAEAAADPDGSVLEAGRGLLALLHQRLDRLEQA